MISKTSLNFAFLMFLPIIVVGAAFIGDWCRAKFAALHFKSRGHLDGAFPY